MTDILDVRPRAEDPLEQHLSEVQLLLSRHRRVEEVVHRQEMPRHELVEDIVHKQHLVELQRLLDRLDTSYIARILETLPEEDRLVTWQQVDEARCDDILEIVSDDVREELVGARPYASVRNMLNAFELRNGRLSQVQVDSRADLANVKPIWVDLVAPSPFVRAWVGKYFGLELPNPEELTDLEASARFYVDDNGELHLHSDFLLDTDTESRNVAVAFILHNDILFSVRQEELPVFRLQRLRARTEVGYVTEGKDVLLDLYAADAEYSADALEDVYADFEAVSKKVLHPNVTDEEAAHILSEIARGEDLNGRIRRNVLDTRRALSFLMRGKLLTTDQQDEARQILRDIESLDGHTTFLFGKINFLMDATVGFININQNKRVSKLTTISVVFMPINILAGIGGMSEYSMMTKDIPWPIAYAAFTVGMAFVGWTTYVALRWLERRKGGKPREGGRQS
ncbi:magnesium and cobalt transport protein CorA [Sulfurisoma sediminicola]|uniref:Magnesium transporter n=1 Tax=Sulfurisoma sediminicola TaxID=1381557 RepID=A0A497XME2_9PROT|nr:magnesium and cobalt transport protein CorA [Sulfurisoma sediminicola]RLJ68406.1 magnesium transporter [Sulfurisoma sediminicola]